MKDATVDGVFAIWYGKGPGVDRSGDPLKHGNYTGSHPRGGVLVLLGDDHPGKSSTIAHHSEQAMAAHHMPVIYPAGVAEVVRFLPFEYTAYFPAAVWLGKVRGAELVRSLVVEAAWVVVMAAACRLAWRRGTARYSAFGG